MQRSRIVNRRAVTLLELIVTIAVMSVLIGGLGSAIMLAGKAVPTEDDRMDLTVDASMHLDRIVADLMFAKQINTVGTSSISVNVPDRDDDTDEETVVFSWSGTPGDPLTFQYDGGTAADLIDSVEDFEIKAHTSGSKTIRLDIALQLDADAVSRVQTSVELVNRP